MAAKKAKKKPAVKRGRKTLYDPSFERIAYRHCLLGATDVELAAILGVSVPTVDKWKQSTPAFLQALKRGKADADARVAFALYHRAIGYKHAAVKILTVSDGGDAGSHVEQIPYVEHYAPDTGAAMAWLKNRAGDKWRDKQVVEHSGSISLEQMIAASWEPPKDPATA